MKIFKIETINTLKNAAKAAAVAFPMIAMTESCSVLCNPCCPPPPPHTHIIIPPPRPHYAPPPRVYRFYTPPPKPVPAPHPRHNANPPSRRGPLADSFELSTDITSLDKV